MYNTALYYHQGDVVDAKYIKESGCWDTCVYNSTPGVEEGAQTVLELIDQPV